MKLVYYCPPWEQYFYGLCPKCNQLSKGIGSFRDDNTYFFKCEPFDFYEEYEETTCSLVGLNCFETQLMRDFWKKYGDSEMPLESGYWIDDMIWHRYCKRIGIDRKVDEMTDEQKEECDKETKEFMDGYKDKVKSYLLDLGFFPKSMRKPCDFEYTIHYPQVQHPENLDDIKEYITEEGYEVMKKLEPIFEGCLSMQEVLENHSGRDNGLTKN